MCKNISLFVSWIMKKLWTRSDLLDTEGSDARWKRPEDNQELVLEPTSSSQGCWRVAGCNERCQTRVRSFAGSLQQLQRNYFERIAWCCRCKRGWQKYKQPKIYGRHGIDSRLSRKVAKNVQYIGAGDESKGLKVNVSKTQVTVVSKGDAQVPANFVINEQRL